MQKAKLVVWAQNYNQIVGIVEDHPKLIKINKPVEGGVTWHGSSQTA